MPIDSLIFPEIPSVPMLMWPNPILACFANEKAIMTILKPSAKMPFLHWLWISKGFLPARL